MCRKNAALQKLQNTLRVQNWWILDHFLVKQGVQLTTISMPCFIIFLNFRHKVNRGLSS